MGDLANALFIELSVTAIILMLIMLYNNIVLYKIKFNDLLTQIVIFTMVLSVSDIAVNMVQYRAGLQWFSYISVCTTTIASVSIGAILLRFVMVRLGCDVKKQWQKTLLFYLPNLIVFLLCATTPWTRLIYYVDESNMIHSMELYGIYILFLVLYTVSAVVISLVVFLRSLKGDADKRHAATTMLIFAGLVFAMQLIQALSLGFDSDFVSISLAWAVALVYLTTNMNMDTLVDNRMRAAAVQADLDTATSIQLDALPKVFPPYEHHPEIDLYATMDTAKEVGGDFFDCFEIDETRVCFVMADVSGKGVPAALFMMTAKTMIKCHAMLKGSTGEIFSRVNNYLSENNEAGMFATAWIGIIDTSDMTLQFTNAGHNYPFLAHSGKNFAEINKTHGLVLGCMEGLRYPADKLKLQKGDTIFLYTDGLTEAHNNADELYEVQRLNELLNTVSDRRGRALLPVIRQSVDDFADGREQFDDITMMAINIL